MKRIDVMHLMIALLIALSLGIMGCASQSSVPPRAAVEDSDLVATNYKAADALLERAPWLKEDRAPLLTATFVNINSLEDSSALGRIMAEHFASRFAQQGFTMIEMKMRNNIFIKEGGGEFVLSRAVRELSQAHDASAVVTGVYAIGRTSTYVTVRLIRATDNLILASYDYTLPLGPNVKALLASQ